MYRLKLTESFVPAQTDDVVRDITVGGLLREIAALHPNETALVEVTTDGETDRRWTYQELLNASEELALALSTRFAPGERLTVWAPNIPEWVLMEYACALAGLVLVTANPAYQMKELRYVLEHSGSAGIFYVGAYRGNPMAEIAQQACAGLTCIREITDLENPIALLRIADKAATLPAVKATDPAQIQYTSGTTGFPKGAVLAHLGLVNNARFFAARAQFRQDMVYANLMPLFHTSGCGMGALGSLQAGCTMILVKSFDASAVNRLIERESINAFVAVPTMLVALLEALEQAPVDLSQLEMVISGGSMVAPELVRNVQQRFDCEFQIVYGQTESSPLVTQHHAKDSLEDICDTVGQPLPQTDISIRSTNDNRTMPIDEVGEICIRGYCMMLGYHADQAATDAAIDAQGWLHTGDLGAMDARGYVRVTGRVKEMIIRGGENHFPVEIENALLEHPDVAEVAIVGLPDPKWGEVIACFVRSERADLDELELHRHCRQLLSPQKTPTVWCKVDAFPLTGSGKIQKFALREQYLSGLHTPM